jgi:hypothetical protein
VTGHPVTGTSRAPHPASARPGTLTSFGYRTVFAACAVLTVAALITTRAVARPAKSLLDPDQVT